MIEWVFLSPHYDDVALSCGGLVWEETQKGRRVQIWTICGGEPREEPLSPFAQSLHERWQTGAQTVSLRQAEDRRSGEILGAEPLTLDIPDCIYRSGSTGHFYASEESLFGEIHPDEQALVCSLAERLRTSVPHQARLVSPLSLGGHVDHRLTRAAAERSKHRLWYYADYPYVIQLPSGRQVAPSGEGWQEKTFRISEAGLAAWQGSIAAHRSQISTFWPDISAMYKAMNDYWRGTRRVVRLWQAPKLGQ